MKTTILNYFTRALKEYNLLILIGVALVIYWRSPNLLANPRMWAEEASVYLEHAIHSNWLNGIVFSPKYTAGYFAFSASIPATIAAHLPLKFAPFITTYFSFTIMLILFGKIIFNKTDFFHSVSNRIVVCFIILFFPSAHASAATWLNSTNLQVYCACISLIILLSEDKDRKYAQMNLATNALLLVFCCLSGPYSLFLAPAFAFRLFTKRNLASLVYLITIILIGGIQTLMYLYLKYSDFLHSTKHAEKSILSTLIGIFKYHIVQPILGMDYSGKFLNQLGYSTNLKEASSDFLMVCGILSTILIIGILIISWKKEYYHKLLTISFLSTSFLTAWFSIWNQPSGRYAFFPAIILGLILFSKSKDFRNNLNSKICITLLSFGLIIGILEFKEFGKNPFLLGSNSYSTWQQQLETWEKDKRARLIVWPAPQWKFQLSQPKEVKKLKDSFKDQELTITSKKDIWTGSFISLEGNVTSFSIEFDISAENIDKEDIIQLRLINSKNPKNFFLTRINYEFETAKTQSFHFGKELMAKKGELTFYDVDKLEIRILSAKNGSELTITNFRYLSPYASFIL